MAKKAIVVNLTMDIVEKVPDLLAPLSNPAVVKDPVTDTNLEKDRAKEKALKKRPVIAADLAKTTDVVKRV